MSILIDFFLAKHILRNGWTRFLPLDIQWKNDRFSLILFVFNQYLKLNYEKQATEDINVSVSVNRAGKKWCREGRLETCTSWTLSASKMQQPLQIRFYSELIKDSQQGRNNASSGVAELLQKTEHNSNVKLQQKVCHLGLPVMGGYKGT